MPRLRNKNEWGAAGANLDPQRADLFRVKMELPDALVGRGTWSNDVEFALETWPFPERRNETIPYKYLNQTNHLLGANVATGPITIAVRYAFNQATAQVLERWNYLASNPRTGGVGLTSQIKARGEFVWLIPNMAVQKNTDSTSPSDDTLIPGLIYVLEGCMPTGLKWTDANMTTGTELAKLQFELSIDRYYPKDIRTMIVGNSNIIQT
jgi:hypothetical protein